MEIESRVDIKRRREEEMAEFLPLKAVERRTIIAALRIDLEKTLTMLQFRGTKVVSKIEVVPGTLAPRESRSSL